MFGCVFGNYLSKVQYLVGYSTGKEGYKGQMREGAYVSRFLLDVLNEFCHFALLNQCVIFYFESSSTALIE